MTIYSQQSDVIVSLKDNFKIISVPNGTGIYDILVYIYAETNSSSIYLGSFESDEKAKKIMNEIWESHRLDYDYWIPEKDGIL